MSVTKKIEEILPEHYRMRKLNKEPFVFLEGPAWDEQTGTLYFTDPLDQKIYKMDAEGCFEVIRCESGYANGMCLNRAGNLVVCKMDTGSIDELEPVKGAGYKKVAEGYNGKPFHATNDVICDSKGGYYITDPFFTYGPRTQDVEATYYHSKSGATLRVATDSIKPNGLALSPDQKYLYIDDTASVNIWRYSVQADGTLADGQIFCRLNPPENIAELPPVQHFGEADGMKVDCRGNVYVTTYTGIQIFNSEGTYLGAIRMPGVESPANLVFGGENLKTIYITARTSLYAVDVLISGC